VYAKKIKITKRKSKRKKMTSLTKHRREFILSTFNILDCTFQNERSWREVVRPECVYDETTGKYSWWKKGVELKFEYISYDKLFQHFFMYGIEMCRNLDDKNLVWIINPQETSEDQIKQIAHDIRKLWKLNVQTRFAVCCNLWAKVNNFSRLNKKLVELIEEFNQEFNEPEKFEEYYDDDVEMEESGSQTPGIQPEPEKKSFELTNCQKEFVSIAIDIITHHFKDPEAWSEITKDTTNWKVGEDLTMEMIDYNKLFLFAIRYGIEPRCNNTTRRLEGINVVGEVSHDEALKQIDEFCNLQIGQKVNVCCEYWNSDAKEGIDKKIGRSMEYFNENFNHEEYDDDEDEDEDEDMQIDCDESNNQIIGKKRTRSKRSHYYDSEDDFDDEDDDDDEEEEEIKKPKRKKRKRSTGIPILDAAKQVLKESGESLHGKEIAKRIVSQGLIQTDCETFRASVTAQIYTDIKKKGNNSNFEKTGPMTFKYHDLNPQITNTTNDAFVIIIPDPHSPITPMPLPIQVNDN
jgi:hypothetical protein